MDQIWQHTLQSAGYLGINIQQASHTELRSNRINNIEIPLKFDGSHCFLLNNTLTNYRIGLYDINSIAYLRPIQNSQNTIDLYGRNQFTIAPYDSYYGVGERSSIRVEGTRPELLCGKNHFRIDPNGINDYQFTGWCSSNIAVDRNVFDNTITIGPAEFPHQQIVCEQLLLPQEAFEQSCDPLTVTPPIAETCDYSSAGKTDNDGVISGLISLKKCKSDIDKSACINAAIENGYVSEVLSCAEDFKAINDSIWLKIRWTMLDAFDLKDNASEQAEHYEKLAALSVKRRDCEFSQALLARLMHDTEKVLYGKVEKIVSINLAFALPHGIKRDELLVKYHYVVDDCLAKGITTSESDYDGYVATKNSSSSTSTISCSINPCPIDNIMTVKCISNNIEAYDIVIVSELGQVVYTESKRYSDYGDNNSVIDMKKYPSGTYYVILKSGLARCVHAAQVVH